MSDAPQEPTAPPRRLHTEAIERRGRWPGIVWAIPLAALLVVIYLGLQALANHGFDVVVTFKTSGGAIAGQTPVVYKGVTVGHVRRIRIAENARDVDMTLRLDPRARTGMRVGAKFWLIGAEPSLTDLSSLKAVISGVSIGVSPGGGVALRKFVGLDQPPAVPPDQLGTLYVLTGDQIGSTRVGSGVYYHGLQVGRVTRVQVADSQTMRLVIFVNAPFDRLVHAGTLFFNANAANIVLSSGHLNATIGPGSSVITGGIEFDTPRLVSGQPQSPSNTTFGFFANEAEAADQSKGPEVQYRATFVAATQKPQVDAPVWLAGVRIGRVLKSDVSIPAGAEAPSTEVTFEIEPDKLGAQGRSETDAKLKGLIRGGYRMKMGQYPPFVGSAILVLQRVSGAKRAVLGQGDVADIPAINASGVDDLSDKASAILDKVNAIPITQIGDNVREITSHLSQIVSSPELNDSLHKLNGTLTSVDQMAREIKPQVGPLVAELRQTADQLQGVAQNANAVLGGSSAGQDANLPAALEQVTDAARSIRSLADYLGNHPDALLKGKQPSK